MRRRGFFAVLLALPALLKVKEADPCIRIKEIRVDAKGHVLSWRYSQALGPPARGNIA